MSKIRNEEKRAVRITDGAAKKLTFAKLARIVDGSDGRTYIAEYSMYGFVSIMQGNMKYRQETIHDRDPRFAEAMELFA